jgi:acetate kinase
MNAVAPQRRAPSEERGAPSVNDCVLVLNAGSSSLKFAVYSRRKRGPWELTSRGQIQGIGSSPHMLVRNAAGEKMSTPELTTEGRDRRSALDFLVVWLRSQLVRARLVGVGHRVVHGGPEHPGPVIINARVLAELHELEPLAPLHQPYNVFAIEMVAQGLSQVPQVACFDTSFHRTMPEVAQLVPLPRELRDKGLKRYGFHGLSCEYIASVLPDVAPELAAKRVIIAHLGSGASLCALRAGRSIESTMSFTALDGLCMGTRPGALDPGVVLYLFQVLHLAPEQVETILYKRSGLLGISGISNDMRDLERSAEPAARLAVDYFVYRIAKEIGALAAALGGLDGLVFTAGIGENSPSIRARICEACAWLGVKLDSRANDANDTRISQSGSALSVLRIATDEELMIARHTGRLLGLIQSAA